MGGLNQSQLQAPTLLTEDHDISEFDSGEDILDDWLRQRALANLSAGTSRTFVVCTESNQVAGYYSLASGSISRANVSGKFRRNTPDPIPAVILGRLAVDLNFQKIGLGSDLLADAVKRTAQAAQHIGVRLLLVHALNDEASQFYRHHGFRPSPTDALDLMISIEEIDSNL